MMLKNSIIILYKFLSISHPQSQSNSKKVYLKGVTLKSTGVYRCEVSAEEPDFKTVTGEGKLEVICKCLNNFLIFLKVSFLSYFVSVLNAFHHSTQGVKENHRKEENFCG